VGVVVVIEMPSLSRFEVVGAYQCCPLIDGVGSLLLRVLIVIMGDENAIISRTSGCADTQVGAMERGR
jgi:hypothetical protein